MADRDIWQRLTKWQSENKAAKHLTGDSDGDALEDGVKAEGGDEQDAVAQGARVAQHRRNRVIVSVCFLRHITNQANEIYGLTWSRTTMNLETEVSSRYSL